MISICGGYELDDDPERIDPGAVWAFLSMRAISERFPGIRLLPGARCRPTRILRGYEALPARLR
jgi:hypothetical protein